METTRSRIWLSWLAVFAVVTALVAAACALPQKAIADDNLAAGQPRLQDDNAQAQTGWIRLAGEKALDTMVKIVEQGWDTADTVVLTTQEGYWDALTASGIAGQANAPILMTDTLTLSTQTKTLLAKLKPTTIIVVGGPAAVTENVAKAAAAATTVDTVVKRAAGEDAVGTANDVAAKTAEYTGGQWSNSIAFVCTNDGYWDALAAAPVAYSQHFPIFLADGHDKLTESTMKAMANAGVKNVYIVGGEKALSKAVKEQLENAGFSTKRLQGETAVETSEAVANEGLSLGMTADNMGVATMEGYWDALAGSALCGSKGGVMVLVNASGDSDSITNFIAKNKDGITTGFIFGGTSAISAGVEKAIKAAAPPTEKVTVTFVVDKKNFDYQFAEGYEQTEIDIATPEAQTIKKGSALNSLPEPSATVAIGKTAAGATQSLEFFPEWYTTKDCSGDPVTIATTFSADTTLYAKIVPAFVTVNLQSSAAQVESGEYDQTVHFTQKQFVALKSKGDAISAVYDTNWVSTSTSYVSLDALFAAADGKLTADSSAFATAWNSGEGGVFVAANDGQNNVYSISDMKAGSFYPKYVGAANGDATGKAAITPALTLSEKASQIATTAEAAQQDNAEHQVEIGAEEGDCNPRMIVGLTESQFKAASTLAADKFISNITTVTLRTSEAASLVTVAFDVNAPEGKAVGAVPSQTIAKGGKVSTKPAEGIDLTDMKCENHEFLGWFAHAQDQEGEEPEKAIDLSTFEFSESTTLYARWQSAMM